MSAWEQVDSAQQANDDVISKNVLEQIIKESFDVFDKDNTGYVPKGFLQITAYYF